MSISRGLAAVSLVALLSPLGGAAASEARTDAAAGIAAIVSGSAHTCVLLPSGGVKCWGRNDFGQLADGTVNHRSIPVAAGGLSAGVAAIALGDSHTCALLSTGGVACWGRNDAGQLGNGTKVSSKTPVAVTGVTGAIAVSAGSRQSCALVTGGGVKCWGFNGRGQLGNGTKVDSAVPVDVSGLTGATALSSGGGHTCALLAAGGVTCWGNNSHGQLGNGTRTNSTKPSAVADLSSVTAIGSGFFHTCAVVVGGGVKCWGLSGWSGPDRKKPVAVKNLASGAAAVAGGAFHTCALLSSGGVKCWGRNTSGQLGTGKAGGPRTKPAGVSGLSAGVAAIAPGGRHSCALLSNGGAKCWGDNYWGQLGNGKSKNFGSAKPVAVSGL